MIDELAKAMPDRSFFSISEKSSAGYVHSEFKKWSPDARRKKILRHLAELELLWGSKLFIGSKTTNVSWMVNAYRGGEDVAWVD